MNAVSNEKRPTSMAFYIRPTATQISRGFKVNNVITCESKVQVVVSQGRHWVLFALGRHWVLTNGTWHVLLQSGNVFELGGITINFVFRESQCFPKRSRGKHSDSSFRHWVFAMFPAHVVMWPWTVLAGKTPAIDFRQYKINENNCWHLRFSFINLQRV